MTPGARISAAIEILDTTASGVPAEQVLTTWARKNRYAGSKDRAAIRDLVFDALRCRRSFTALGGAETGRGLMIGALRAAGANPGDLFSGLGYAPDPLTEAEQAAGRRWADLDEFERLDCPDWIGTELRDSLGAEFTPVMEMMRHRAPVFLRVNGLKADPATAIAALAADDITAVPHELATTALEVTENARRIRQSGAYRDGLVELQDAASQALVEALPPAGRILDYCAGGGGKALAIAARTGSEVFVHDALPQRMNDLPERARRAGATLTVLTEDAVASTGPFDLVLCDVPCSGTGAWRRQVEAKWTLSEARLAALVSLQATILDKAQALVGPGGTLGYATCSLLRRENEDQVAALQDRWPGWVTGALRRWTPRAGGDGFGLALLLREDVP